MAKYSVLLCLAVMADSSTAAVAGGCPCYYDGSMHDCNKSPFPNDNRCVCGTSGSDWKSPDQCKAPVLEVKAEGGCPCYYDGSMHDCNKSPFSGDNRCVCGTSGSDWKSPDQCRAPTPAPQPPSDVCPCYYDGSMHNCAKSPFPNDNRCVCGTSGSDWKSPDQCKAPVLEVKSEGGCPCYYDGSMHDCNKSPFSGDNRCVCGTSGSDWKSPDQCRAPATPAPAPPSDVCPCYYDGSMHYCNKSPFPNDNRCVCGTSGSDWKSPDQCKAPVLEVKAEGGCPCYYDGSMHDCNKSPFPNDNRCVCGTSGSDWKSPDQCKAPVLEVKAEGGCPCFYDGSMHDCNKSPFAGDNRCVCGTSADDWRTPARCGAGAVFVV